MTTVRRTEFVSSQQNREIRVQTAANDPALQALNVAAADLNGDGYVRGDREMDALFTLLDRHDNNGDRNSVNAQTGSRVLDLLTALSRNTTASSTFGATLAREGERLLNARTRAHTDAITATGIGTHYGDHSSYAALSETDKRTFIDANKLPGTQPGTPVQSSCIGWAMENVGAAYAAAGKSTRWAEIQRTVIRNGAKGTELAKELKKDGWQALYWNPDTTTPADGSAEHTFSAAQVRRGRGYYGIAIDGQVTNYRPTSGGNTVEDKTGIDKLAQVPFFFGLARGGTHTFVGTRGQVNELHWAEDPTSPHLIEQSPLKDFAWLSGLIMVPPGNW